MFKKLRREKNVEALLNMLGYKGKDKVTGYTGVITSTSVDLYGCLQVLLTTEIDENHEWNCRWFDMNRIELISVDRIMEPQNKELYSDKGPSTKTCYEEQPPME